MSLRTGDLRTGLAMANASTDKQLLKECASILEGYVMRYSLRCYHGRNPSRVAMCRAENMCVPLRCTVCVSLLPD